ncbi:MAG: alginate export family protein [Candidatus Omnitrophica bacterium]|nr:alginate export family protein [Candidatus Omnitrophota bacterium]
MGKRLILILTLAFVVGIAFAAYAEVQNVKVSGDLTVYGISRNLAMRGGNNQATENALASIARVRIDADLTDNVIATVRLLNERYWGNETNNSGTSGVNTDINLDLAYVTMKEFLYSPLTLTVGRQELHFGNDMILGDPDTNNQVTTASPFFGTAANGADRDLTARKSFDAVRATLNYDPLVVDIVAAKINETGLKPNDDMDLYGVNLNYNLGKKNTIIEGYFWEKRTGRAATDPTIRKSSPDTVNTVGARVSSEPIENLTAQVEGAFQFGTRVPQTTDTNYTAATPTHAVDRRAFALETMLTYNWKKVKYNPVTSLCYAYFSGDHENNVVDNNNGAWRGWDPMFENQKFGDIANALFNQTNAHIIGGIVSMKPVDDVTLKGEYYAFWWAKAYPNGVNVVTATARNGTDNYNMTGRRFAGQEVDLTATYDYTEDVQFGLMGGIFLPGASFAKANSDTASEVIGSMKVTF